MTLLHLLLAFGAVTAYLFTLFVAYAVGCSFGYAAAVKDFYDGLPVPAAPPPASPAVSIKPHPQPEL